MSQPPSVCATAAAMAGAGPSAGSFGYALGPKGSPVRGGNSTNSTSMGGEVGGGGDDVVGVLAVLHRAVVENHVLVESPADPGFETRRLGVMVVNPGQGGSDQPRAEQFYRSVLERIGGIPGLRSASWASNLPLFGGFQRSVFPEGLENQEREKGVLVQTNVVEPGFFETFDVALLRGRDFSAGDRKKSVPVAVINEKMAQQFWPGENALGKRFRMYGNEFFQEVVGIAETTKIATLGEDPQPCAYLPLEQNYSDAMTLYLRSEGDPAPVMTAAQREIRALDALVPVINPLTVGEVIDQSPFAPKLAAGLPGVMGMMALALASVGLYGVLAFRVTQGFREIGLRMALGARRSDVLWMVLTNAMMLVGAGAGIGLAAVALVASSIPALRASRVDPLVALRHR